MREARQIVVSGRVQGVMFRHFTRQNAHTLGVVGEVKNCLDGTVKVIAEGEPHALDMFVKKLTQGPLFARVDDVTQTSVEPTGSYTKFSIVYD